MIKKSYKGGDLWFTKQRWKTFARRVLEREEKRWPPYVELFCYRSKEGIEIFIERDRFSVPEQKDLILNRAKLLKSLGSQKIYLKRRELKLTQAELARRAGISRVQIYRIENRKLQLTLKHAKAIGPVLGIPYYELI